MNSNRTFQPTESIFQDTIKELKITNSDGAKRITFPVKQKFLECVLTGDTTWMDEQMKKVKSDYVNIIAKPMLGEDEIKIMKDKTKESAFSLVVCKDNVYVGRSAALSFEAKSKKRNNTRPPPEKAFDEKMSDVFDTPDKYSSLTLTDERVLNAGHLASLILREIVTGYSDMEENLIRKLAKASYADLTPLVMLAAIYWDSDVTKLNLERNRLDASVVNKREEQLRLTIAMYAKLLIFDFNILDVTEKSLIRTDEIVKNIMAGYTGLFDFDDKSNLLTKKIGICGIYFNCRHKESMTYTFFPKREQSQKRVGLLSQGDNDQNVANFL